MKYVIFDLDGTLIDTSEGIVDAVNYALKRTGNQQRTSEEIIPHIGYPLEDAFGNFTETPFSELYPHFRKRGDSAIVSSALALPRADEVLTQLRKMSLCMAIATNKSRIDVEQIVRKLGWSELFDVTVTKSDVEKCKPSPEAVQKALGALSAEPSDAVMIGDTCNDILAGKAAAVTTVGVSSPYGPDERLLVSKPDFFIRTLAEFPELLQSLSAQKVRR